MANKSVSTSIKEKIEKKTKSKSSLKKTQDKIIVKTPPKKTKKNDKNQISITHFIKKCVNTINSNDITEQLKHNEEIEYTSPNIQSKQTKRKLTLEEKENICDFLSVNPGCDFEHAICILENIKKDILNQLENIEIYPSLIPSLKNEIINYYNRSQIQPGQMVGVDSATSLGEPTTQMSVVKNEVVNIVKVEKKTNDISFISSTIGKFCDNIIKQYPEYTFNTHSNNLNSVETDLKYLDYDYYVVSVNKNEKTEWNKISHISRHPVNGQIVKVKTKSGRTIETTLSHSHLTRKNNSVVPIKGSELKIGMRIPVCKFISDKFTISKNKTIYDNYDEHSVFYLAEDIAYYRKKSIPNSVFLLPNKLKKVFIKTIFDILSIPSINNEYENYEIELVSSKQIVLDLSLLLNYFGIFSKIKMINTNDDKFQLTIPNQYIPIFNLIISQNHKINNDYIFYNKTDDGLDSIHGVNDILIKCVNTLKLNIPINTLDTSISRKTITNFLKTFDEYDCSEIENEVKILKQTIYSDIVWDEIVELDIYTPSQKDFVYDFTVPGCETFLLNCGILTHNTLNSFHSAGKTCAAVTTGVPRFRELIDASKQQKHTLITFTLNDKENLKIKEIQDAKRLCRQFDEKRILSLLEINIPEISNYRYNNLNQEKDWYLFFETFIHSEFKKFNWSLRFIFNKDSLFEYRLTLKHISQFIEKELGNCVCVYSPDNIGIIDVYIDVSNIKKDELISYRKQIDTIKKIDKKKTLIDENNKYYYYIRDIIFQYICNIKVSGIDCIEKGYFRQEKINGINKWVFDLEGTNYREILNHPLVNYKECMVNNMWELFNTLGIEAVRGFLINEFNEVITSGGINVDKTHLELLADSMTCTGNITSVSRYGIGRNETGPLTKASFEQSLDNMLIAAYRSETESIKSVSSSIIMGQCSRIGSGIMELYTNINPIIDDDLYDYDTDINEEDNDDKKDKDIKDIKNIDKQNEEFVF